VFEMLIVKFVQVTADVDRVHVDIRLNRRGHVGLL
jgi:hypothetical protein